MHGVGSGSNILGGHRDVIIRHSTTLGGHMDWVVGHINMSEGHMNWIGVHSNMLGGHMVGVVSISTCREAIGWCCTS